MLDLIFNPNFIYSIYLFNLFYYLSNSSIASSVAVKILSPKFGRLGYYYSKAKMRDWFNGTLKYCSDWILQTKDTK